MDGRDQAKGVANLVGVVARVGNHDPPQDVGIERGRAGRPFVGGPGLDTFGEIANGFGGGGESVATGLDVAGPTVVDCRLQGVGNAIKEHHDDF